MDQLGAFRPDPISVEEVAGAVAETIAQGQNAPFRSPVGEPAARALQARKEAPEETPFLPAPLRW